MTVETPAQSAKALKYVKRMVHFSSGNLAKPDADHRQKLLYIADINSIYLNKHEQSSPIFLTPYTSGLLPVRCRGVSDALDRPNANLGSCVQHE
jgi:hypothetical protein